MKFQTRLIAVAAVAALLPLTANAERGFFVAASVGSADLSESLDGFDVDADSTAFRLTGGWRFNEFVAVEAGYHNFGRFEQTVDDAGTPVEISLKADGFTLGATGTLPLGERFALFGRGGAFFWDGDAEINGVSQADPSDTNMYLGAGVRYSLTDNLAATADGSRYKLEDVSSTVFSIGFDYRF